MIGRVCLTKAISKFEGGFSLIELMVVISIISVLVAFSFPAYQDFLSRARQTEAKLNLKHIHTLFESLEDEPPSVIVPGNLYYLSENDVSSENSCHNSNELGFRVTNCPKANYWYFVFPEFAWSTKTNWSVYAMEISNPRRTVVPRCSLPNSLDLQIYCIFNTSTFIFPGSKSSCGAGEIFHHRDAVKVC